MNNIRFLEYITNNSNNNNNNCKEYIYLIYHVVLLKCFKSLNIIDISIRYWVVILQVI